MSRDDIARLDAMIGLIGRVQLDPTAATTGDPALDEIRIDLIRRLEDLRSVTVPGSATPTATAALRYGRHPTR